MLSSKNPIIELHIITHDFKELIFTLNETGIYRIGRDPKCEVHVDDPDVSRLHAQLLWDGKVLTIEDLRSTNGIFLNGEKTVCNKLTNGDIVAFGSSVFRTQIIEPTQSAS